MTRQNKTRRLSVALLILPMLLLAAPVDVRKDVTVSRDTPNGNSFSVNSGETFTVTLAISAKNNNSSDVSGSYTLTSNSNFSRTSGAETGTYGPLSPGGSVQLTWTFKAPTVTSTTDFSDPITLKATVTGTSSETSGGYNKVTVNAPTSDTTPPVVTGTISPSADSSGWNNTDVLITWSASDPESGITSGPTPSSTTVSTEGAGQVFTATAVNGVALTGTGSVTVNIDKTDPVTTAAPSGTAGSGSWWVSDVVVTLSATDSISGVASTEYNDGAGWTSYTGPFTVSAEGTTTVYFRSKDTAGNTEAENALVINIDKSSPSLTLSPAGTKGNGDWFTSVVTVTLVGNDTGGSGFDHAEYSLDGAAYTSYEGPFVISDDGVHTLGCKAFDNAGNEYDPEDQTIRIDATAPTITCSAVTADGNPYTAGTWTNQDVTVTFAASDATSGLASVTDPVTVSSQGKDQSVSGTATDAAGNTATTTFTGINIDKTPPVTTVNFSGARSAVVGWTDWYVQTVAVTLSATDDPQDDSSGVKEIRYQWKDAGYTYAGQFAITDQGEGTLTYWAVDNAGNVEEGKTEAIKIDTRPPEVSVSLPGTGVYMVGQIVNVSWSAIDPTPGSGLATTSGGTTSFTAGELGEYTNVDLFPVGFAKDHVGNESAAVPVVYSVSYRFGGFLQPINVDGTSIFKLGSTIPVKFQLFTKDATGNVVPTAVPAGSPVPAIMVAKISSGVTGTYVEATSTAAATTGNAFRYDSTAQQYIFNLATKPLSTGTWMVRAILNVGGMDLPYEVKISLR